MTCLSGRPSAAVGGVALFLGCACSPGVGGEGTLGSYRVIAVESQLPEPRPKPSEPLVSGLAYEEPEWRPRAESSVDYFPVQAPRLRLVCSLGPRVIVRLGDGARYAMLDVREPRSVQAIRPKVAESCIREDIFDVGPRVGNSADARAPSGEPLQRLGQSIQGVEAFASSDPSRGIRTSYGVVQLTHWWRYREEGFIKTRRVQVLRVDSASWAFVADWTDNSVWRFDLGRRRAIRLLEDATCALGINATHVGERALVWCDGGEDVTPWAFSLDLTTRTSTLIEGGRELMLMADGTVVGVVPGLTVDEAPFDGVAILDGPRL